MSYIVIKKSKIRKLPLPKGFDVDNIQVGIPVHKNEEDILNIRNIGDIVLPSAHFGPVCKKNAYGDVVVDKTQPKERRYVSTIWVQPFGNYYADSTPVDIYKPCYPKIEIPPMEIELMLVLDKDNRKYIIADIDKKQNEENLLSAINIFLEIYGECYIFNGELNINNDSKRQKCNWEILPPGEKPSVHIKNMLKANAQNADTFDVSRLEFLDKYKVEKIVEGTNGFNGYYAYIFNNICLLESAIYGNATYVIPKENWEILSQKNKKELFDEKHVIEKIIHKENWKRQIRITIKKLENQ